MSDKKNEKKSLSEKNKKNFEDFEEAFFNEGDFQVQEAETGSYMLEDFGTDIWEDFDLPLENPSKLPIDDLAVPPKKSKKEETKEEAPFQGDALDDSFALEGFEIDDIPFADQTATEALELGEAVQVEVEEFDDFLLDDVEESLNELSFDQETTVQIPITENNVKPTDIEKEVGKDSSLTNSFVEEDFGVGTLEEEDEFFDFEIEEQIPIDAIDAPSIVEDSLQQEFGAPEEQFSDDDFVLDDMDMDVVMEESAPADVIPEDVPYAKGAIALLTEEAKTTGEVSLFLEAAYLSYIRNESSKALDILSQIPKSAQRKKDFYYLQVQAAYDCSDLRVFCEALSALLPLVSPEERSALFVMSARLFQNKEDLQNAQESLVQAVSEDPNHVYAYLMLRDNSKHIGDWNQFIHATTELARCSTPTISSIFLQSAAEVCFDRNNDKKEAKKHLVEGSFYQGRTFAKLMTNLGWPSVDHRVEGYSLLKLYSTLRQYKEQRSENNAHPIFRWADILHGASDRQRERLQKNDVFAQDIEATLTKLLLARSTSDVSHAASAIQNNPSLLLGIQSSLDTIEEAQNILFQCDNEKHGQATRWAILQDLYRTAPFSGGTPKPKMGRSWLGVYKGSVTVHPSSVKEIFDFPHAGVIQELWYIHLSMKAELEELYLERARQASREDWRAHWLFQAGLVQNNKEYFEQARACSESIPLGYTREYIASWKEWQFGTGTFHACIELLEKQAEISGLSEYHVAASLLKGRSTEKYGFGGLRLVSSLGSDSTGEQLTNYMNTLTEHEQQWLSLIVLLSNPTKEQCVASFAYIPSLSTELLLAFGLSSFDLSSHELYALLDSNMGHSPEQEELRLALLFCGNNETQTSKNLHKIQTDSMREDISILAEICGMWDIAKEYAPHPEEVLGVLQREEAGALFAERIQQESHPNTALNLIQIQEDSIVGYQALLEASRGTPLEYGLHSRLASILSKDEDSQSTITHLQRVFDNKKVIGLHTQQLMKLLYRDQKSQEMSAMALSCPDMNTEASRRLLELEAWDEAIQVVTNGTTGFVHDFRMESIQKGRLQWQEYYELLQKRIDLWQSTSARKDAEQECASIMLEHLADKSFTLLYYQKKAKEFPNSTEILEALSRIAIAQGDVQGGIQTLTSLYEQASSSLQAAQYLFRIAQALEGDGRRLPAIEKLKQVLDVHPTYKEARELLKHLLYEGQYTDNLIQVLEQEIEYLRGKEQMSVMIELADLYSNMLNDFDRALNIWSKIWHNDEQNLDALKQLIVIARKANNEDQLVRYMQEMQVKSPSADLIIELADRLQNLGRKKEYEKSLLDATDFASVRLSALQRLSTLYKDQQDSEKYSQTMLSIAEETSEKEEKVQILEQVLLENEQSIRSQDELFRICSMIEELNPNHERSLLFISEYHYKAGSFALAIPYFERVCTEKKSLAVSSFEGRMAHSDLLFRFANALHKEKKEAESISVLQELLEMIPYHMQALRLIGPMLVEKGELSQAAQVYKSLLMNVGSESPESLPLYLELGDIEVARGNKEQAIQFFVRAFRMEPENIRVMLSLARLCVQLKRWNKALQLYQKLLSTRKVSKEVTMEGMLVKAWILDKTLGLYDIAYKHLEQSLQYESNQPIVLLCMAEMKFRKEFYAPALVLLKKMMTLEECSYHRLALLLQSSCLIHEGQESEGHAIQEFLKILPSELSTQLEEGFSTPLF